MNKLKVLLLGCLFLVACADGSNVPANIQSDSQDAIIGGGRSEIGGHVMRSTVALYDMDAQALCSGSLIAKNLVLTAGHCVSRTASRMLVIFASDLKDAESDASHIRHGTGVRVHKDYDVKRKFNAADIALLKFSGPLPAGYAPAKFLTKTSLIKVGARVGIAGYGVSHPENGGYSDGSGILRNTVVKVLDDKFSETEFSVDQTQNKGACSGDSGGPAFMMIEGRLNLVGIASRTAAMAGFPQCSMFTLYTRTDSFKGWIAAKSAELLN